MPLSVLRGEQPPTGKWTEQDGLLAQALDYHERMLCPGCGWPLWESMDIANDGQFFAPAPLRCHACSVIYDRMKHDHEANPDRRAPEALRYRAELEPV